MKKKVLLSSVLTIALCLSLIAGSTFALFTSQSENNIAVTAAKVEMTADITNLTLASVRPATVAEVRAAAEGADITIIEDKFGGQYVYEERKDGTFANGGTANFEDAVLTLDRITPGDKVSFDVVGANTSDVTIQYRYVIECMDGKELMSGLLISVEGVTYEFLGSYTSGWKTLTPGTDITPVPVVVEFPVTVGNDLQGLDTAIKVTVEAVQGNADVAGSDLPVVEFLDGIAVDLAGRAMPINAGVVNTGSLNLSNGSIVIDEVGFENYGNATLTNVAIQGGTSGTIAYGYGVIGGANSVTVLNDVTINSANGAIAATDGAELTFNGGYVEVDSKSTSGRYLFYVVGEGTVATINDGEFFFNKTQNQKRAYAYVGEGATLKITGGNFGTASSRSGYTAGILGEGTVIITGGTFGFDPTAWVADGYKAAKSGTSWTVIPEAAELATDNTTFNTAIQGGATTVYLGSGDYIIPAAAKGKTLTIVGNGNTSVAVTKVGNGGENCDYGLDGSTVTFENITITTNSSTYIGYARCNATYNNCTINGTYTLYGNSVFNNCTFNVSGDVYNIWTWGAPTAEFNNCTFNSDGKALLLYGQANTKLTVNDCTFNDNGGLTDKKAAIEIGNDYNKSYELIVNNTTVNGYEINDKGINTETTLWANKNSMGTDKLNVVVDGVDIY